MPVPAGRIHPEKRKRDSDSRRISYPGRILSQVVRPPEFRFRAPKKPRGSPEAPGGLRARARIKIYQDLKRKRSEEEQGFPGIKGGGPWSMVRTWRGALGG